MFAELNLISVKRRSRSDVRQWVSEWVSQSVSEGTDRDFTVVTLVSDDTYRRLYWCDPDNSDGPDDPDESYLEMKVI